MRATGLSSESEQMVLKQHAAQANMVLRLVLQKRLQISQLFATEEKVEFINMLSMYAIAA